MAFTQGSGEQGNKGHREHGIKGSRNQGFKGSRDQRRGAGCEAGFGLTIKGGRRAASHHFCLVWFGTLAGSPTRHTTVPPRTTRVSPQSQLAPALSTITITDSRHKPQYAIHNPQFTITITGSPGHTTVGPLEDNSSLTTIDGTTITIGINHHHSWHQLNSHRHLAQQICRNHNKH